MRTSPRHDGHTSPASAPERPAARLRHAPGVLALSVLSLLTLLALPRESAAKYGSPLVVHLAATSHRGTVLSSAARRDVTPHRAAARLGRTANAGAVDPGPHDEPATARLASWSEFGNGIVLGRPARPASHSVAVQPVLVPAPRFADACRASRRHDADFQCAAGPAHRLRAPPATSL